MTAMKRFVRSTTVAMAAAGVLLGALSGTAQAREGLPIIKRGSTGHGVWCVQHAVNNWAQRTNQGRPLAEDNAFGVNTENWVKKFQQASGRSVDGRVGPNTGNSIQDNAGYYRNYCYNYVPTTY